MDRASWRATVQGVTKVLDMTESAEWQNYRAGCAISWLATDIFIKCKYISREMGRID